MLLAVPLAQAQQPDPIWFTTNNVLVPPQPYAPQINALAFVCDKQFILNNYSTNSITYSGGFYSGFQAEAFRTANTLNWTNTGTLTSLTGFDFQTGPDGVWNTEGPRMASTFVNTSPGSINVGTNGGSYYLPLFGLFGNYFGSAAQLLISATNVVNRSPINMGVNTLLSITGDDVDLSRSTLSMEGFSSSLFFSTDGMFDGYWGVGTNSMDPVFDFEFLPYWTPYHVVTNRNYFLDFIQLAFTDADFYLSEFTINTNRSSLSVFLNNPNPAINNRVYFFNGSDEIIVEWNWLGTNVTTGLRETNYLYLYDYPATGTNIVWANGTYGGLTTYIPNGFQFSRSQQPLVTGPGAQTTSPLGVFDNGVVTNAYIAYQAIFKPYTTDPGQIFGQSETNLPGRVEITGNHTLNLNRTRITANNFISLSATNHFLGSSNAVIAAPFISLNLTSTNGTLVLSNTVVPTLARPEGTISLWSGRWTNSPANSNKFHVLFVDSQLVTFSKPIAVDVILTATNVLISDAMNIRSNLFITARNLTLTTNPPGAPSLAGTINLLSPTFPSWQHLAPNLQNFTNNGSLTTPNFDGFAGYRMPPYYPTTYVEPYLSMVNRGTITNDGADIWANYFVNGGAVNVGSGALSVRAGQALLTNGMFLASSGNMDIAANTLVISNHNLTVGVALTLGAVSLLDDGSVAQSVALVTNKNTWRVGYGFSLTNQPAVGSLLATTIRDTAPALVDVVIPHVWPGVDRGAVPLGYTTNCAIGRLILNSAQPCQFVFAGTGLSNALYVDSLELFGTATTRDDNGDVTALDIAPNLVIYYAQARMNGLSVAEKLNHRNNDRLRWVSTYAGYYSSTNILYPDGKVYAFNAALAASCNYDSNGNGIANCSDPTPIFVLEQFTAAITSKAVQLGWNVNAGGLGTNTVYYTPTLTPSNWQVLTQFVSGPGRLGASDVIGRTNRFYRVNVSVQQP
jgi:hypothetical protein